ncbi:glycosyltransferase family 2 protein [Solemya velesiana gill symbiont]|uniref:Glycosyl transferase n=1 Tax=Solemya velesiana gill symbiont TaxID=1918948 RepID=A0A1T2KTU5_9GAMM|nr:glycosyltransferase [Solemya velesiana gill symbiont]OOZ36221.1 glycosyl transferase [Solemya velesiana gill symbiont]
MPQISVLLPFRNMEQTLDECLASINGQTLKDYELLAVNDHSTDGSRALVANLAANDSRIRLFDNKGNGLVDALNHGLSKARTGLVARMDGDDVMHPRRLERQFEHMQHHPEVALLGCATRLFPEHVILNGYREYIRWQNSCNTPEQIADEIYIESPFAHPGVVFRKQIVERLGGYRDGPFPEDYELWLRLHRAGYRMAKLPEILLDWREYPSRTSRVDLRYSRDAFDRLRADYLSREHRLLKKRDCLAIWGAGRKTRKRCKPLLQKGFKPIAWIDIDPKKIGNRLEGVPVVDPGWLGETMPKPYVLVYVANHGARELIARDLHRFGYKRGTDYLMVG